MRRPVALAALAILAALTTCAVAGDAGLPRPVYSGLLPVGVDGGIGAYLADTGKQWLLSETDGRLTAYEFGQGRFIKRGSIPLPTPFLDPVDSSEISVSASSCVGDVNGDGLDEVLVVDGREVRVYRWVRDAFALIAVSGVRPKGASRGWWISDIAVGDANNDDTNEVLLTGVERPPTVEDMAAPTVVLFICRWRGDSLVQLWNDGGSLELEGPNWFVPCGKIIGVMDLRNAGHNELIVSTGQSDVSATAYREFSWTGAALRDSGPFLLRGRRLSRKVGNGQPIGAAVGRFDFWRTEDGTVLLFGVPHDSYVWRGEMYRFVGGSLASMRTIWNDSDVDERRSPSSSGFIDLDGSGTGIIRTIFRHDSRVRYEFYRL